MGDKKIIRWIKELSLKKKIMAVLFAAAMTAFFFCLPSPLFNSPSSVIVEDYRGELLSASIAADGQWRFPAGDTIPDKFVKCITAFEDKRFFYHPGVDLLSVARAFRQNLKAGKTISGGSTITMQVIRLATGKRRTLFNKLAEGIRALRLELGCSKDEIIGLYAANAPFGSNVVGLEAASWRYFGRSPDKLSWGETAALAVLPNAPSLVHPGKNRAILLAKRNRLLDVLKSEGVLDQSETELAKLEPVPEKPVTLPQYAPHLLALARKDLAAKRIKNARVKSSIRLQLQERVNSILANHHQRLAANGVNNMAALVIDIKSNKVLAYTGNIYEPQNAELESHVDVIQAKRSPGSTLKPILFAAMLNEGMLLPNSLVPDIPTQIAGYQPNNYDLGYDGAVPASKALARSLNVPAVRMLQQYKYGRFYDMLKNTGISTLIRPSDFYGLSLILGGCEVNMWELSGIYASMARFLNQAGDTGGIQWERPSYLNAREEGDPQKKTDEGYQLSRAAVWYTFEAMNEVMRPGEEQLWQRFESSQKVAWKTGTSFGFRDAWAIGLTPDYLVAVWAGNADGEGRPGLTGVDAAAPVLFDIFRSLPDPPGKWFTMPRKELVKIKVCTESGFRASDLCNSQKDMWLPAASLKAPVCPYNKLIHLDKSEKWQVTDDCVPVSDMVHRSWFVLPPAMEFYYKTKNYSYKPLPPFLSGCGGERETSLAAMEMIYPKNKARIYVPLELDGRRGQVIFNAAHRRSSEIIYWHLDNQYAGSTRSPHQIALNPSAGTHHITIVDQEGNRLEQTFTILDKEKN
ncbi:penicillin-binding protein 1C [Pararcticibacter amylolyticus]|uniref:peptidoglycan glycosyltransferase n=1 Tax=Pararcticibacter amylolyticus TaxID=2173175 RepID=A0A2U2PG95_9SPHI|nr:penicillin-binding protein 1C [Pararcticibacter amylolyticus]PWG80421.1 penicillin-binding protein 1C [Pararcticibacter amylolyticus]